MNIPTERVSQCSSSVNQKDQKNIFYLLFTSALFLEFIVWNRKLPSWYSPWLFDEVLILPLYAFLFCFTHSQPKANSFPIAWASTTLLWLYTDFMCSRFNPRGFCLYHFVLIAKRNDLSWMNIRVISHKLPNHCPKQGLFCIGSEAILFGSHLT